MYELRFGKLEDLKELGENKERIEELLIQLADLGWPVSHWSENHPETENEKFFMGLRKEDPVLQCRDEFSYKEIKNSS